MSFSFRNLNLANVDVGSGAERLKPGRYTARVTEAELRETKSGGNAVRVTFTDVDGGGMISDFINVNVPKSAEATRIGLERLKALLVHGGHRTPDNPGDIKSLKGLTVGIRVVEEEYTDKDGNKRSGSQIKSYLAVEGGHRPQEAAPTKDTNLDDDIPF
jgi:hypothetical protein